MNPVSMSRFTFDPQAQADVYLRERARAIQHAQLERQASEARREQRATRTASVPAHAVRRVWHRLVLSVRPA